MVSEWTIKDGIFRQTEFEVNPIVEAITGCLSNFSKHSIYLRGSMLESKCPHPNADIDICLIHEAQYISRNEALEIAGSLQHLGRMVDLHLFTPEDLLRDIPNRLLLYATSRHITGKILEIPAVNADQEMMLQHWKIYNPGFAPDVMYSTRRSRVCALKCLTRCFGLISLAEQGVFSRDISFCMDFAKKLNREIHQRLRETWEIVDLKKPLNLKEIKEFLLEYKSSH